MALPDDVLTGLRRLLERSTARITPTDALKPAGAAFFVSDSLLITNRHVIERALPDGGGTTRATEVTVLNRGGRTETGAVLPASATDPDLDIALIRVPSRQDRPAVVLHRELDAGSFLIAGFPREDFYNDLEPGIEIPNPVLGHTNQAQSSGAEQLLRLTGVQIKPGYSGGPVLSTATGAVVAVIVYSENPKDDLGGAALPVGRLLAAYPNELQRLAEEPPPTTTEHQRVLLRPGWERLGLAWDRAHRIDLHLTGTRNCWQVGVRGCEKAERRVSDLGDDMSELLAQWVRSASRREESEVRLLGRVITEALLPDAAAQQLPLRAPRDAEPVQIRLHIDPDGPLADLPWELAVDPRNKKHFLAASEGYVFSRMNPRVPADPLNVMRSRQRDEVVRVLAVVVQPTSIERWPSVADTGDPITWPRCDDIAAALEKCIRSPRLKPEKPAFVVKTLLNPTLSELESQVPDVDVVHYIGFGVQTPEGTAEEAIDRTWIACSAGDGSFDDLRFHSARQLMAVIADKNPELVIFEFGTPPIGRRGENLPNGPLLPIGPALLGAVDALRVEAMVCTRSLHPIQYDRFNKVFYQHLAAGQMLELATQRARSALMMDAPVDYAGFGWFTVTTGNHPGARLFVPPGSAIDTGPEGKGGKSTTAPARAPEPQPASPAQPPPSSAQDAFTISGTGGWG